MLHQTTKLHVFLTMIVLVFASWELPALDQREQTAGESSVNELVALFNLVASGRPGEGRAGLNAVFSDGFLRDVGAGSIFDTVRQIADQHGVVRAVAPSPGISEPKEYKLLFADNMVIAVSLHLEDDSQDSVRIGGIQLGRPRTLDQLLQDRVQRLAARHRNTTIFVAPLGGETLTEVTGSGSEELGDVGSRDRDGRPAAQSVVMYPGRELEHLRLVLRVVSAVAEGSLELSDVVLLTAAHMADEGSLSEKAPGTPYTLYSLGEYLLFEKDQTAQRHIEAALRARRGRLAAEIDWDHRSLYELLERSTALGGEAISPVEYLLGAFFFVESDGPDAAAVVVVPGRNGSTYYVAVSHHDPFLAPDPEILRRDLELLAVPLQLAP